MTGFEFNPPVAVAVSSATQGLSAAIKDISTLVTNLRKADGCGTFPSGSVIKSSLTSLGEIADQMSVRLTTAVEDYERSVIAAGGLISRQEYENERNIRNSSVDHNPSETALPFGILPGSSSPSVIPDGPSLSDQLSAGTNSNVLDVPCVPGNAAGTFACPAGPEDIGGLTLDACIEHLTPAVAAKLSMLAQQWQQLGAELNEAINTFHRIVQTKMQGGTWTGKSGPAVAAAASKLTQTTVEISAQASANGAAIVAWAGSLGDTKSYIDQLATARTTNLAAAAPESRARVQNESDFLARLKIGGTYNPAVTAIASGLSNLTDPSSPVTGVPLMIGGPQGSGSGGSGFGGSGSSSATSGGGGGGGGTGGGASTAATNKSGTDAAKSLTRQGSGDPAAAAASNASKNAAAQSGQGNPASAAQSAMSKAGDTAKGLGGKSGASPLTRSAGLGSLAGAEKSAAAKAAAGLGKGGGGAGGGGAGGGGGIGKMGGAGIAAAEGSLSARGSAGLSAAERAMAAPQAAPAAGRAGMGSGAPMGGARGGHGSENEKEHKSARYLISEENGEEIAGELPDTAPPVLGGLNLDTSDNPDTSR